jgi:hypothetical protein
MVTDFESFWAEEWYLSRPEIIRQAIKRLPPFQYYRMKETGAQCYILSYEEPESDKLEDVTVTVQKTGLGTMFPELNQNQVFGVGLDDLEPWVLPN